MASDPTERLKNILRTLDAHDVHFVTIGNMAARLHGVDVPTEDADVACMRGLENQKRLLAALEALEAQALMAGGGTVDLPTEDPEMLQFMGIWHLDTVHGRLDLVYSPAGGGYEDLVEGAVRVDIGDGSIVLAASLDDIIASKELANREKDHKTLPTLRRYRDQQLRERDGPGLSFDL